MADTQTPDSPSLSARKAQLVREACDCPGCLEGVEPFTVTHFGMWTEQLELDSGAPWFLEPFQSDFARDLFEFIRDGVPAECWLIIPEGNGKTTLVAGLALYVLEHVPNAAIPVAASSKEQADTLYLQAEGFVARTPRLSAEKPNMVLIAKGLEQQNGRFRKEIPRFVCQEGFRRIKYYQGGRMQIRAADDRTGDGIIPAGLMIIDELHRHPDLKLYRTWLGKGEKRKAPLVVISTAGEPGSEFETAREEMRRGDDVVHDRCFVRSRSETSLLHEWAVPEGADVEDLELVAAANPLESVDVETLRRKRAKKSWNLGHWRRFVCNLATRSDFAAIQEAEWYAAGGATLPAGKPVDVGLDLAWKWDTTAAVPLWMKSTTERILGPATVLEPPRDGTSLDPHKVENAISALHARNPIQSVVMDTHAGEQLASWIEEEIGCPVIDRGQSNQYATLDYAKFMEALRSGWLRHCDDPALTAHVLNAIVRVLPGGDARFDRPAQNRRSAEQDRRVIDALVAAAMVHTTATAAPVSQAWVGWAPGEEAA